MGETLAGLLNESIENIDVGDGVKGRITKHYGKTVLELEGSVDTMEKLYSISKIRNNGFEFGKGKRTKLRSKYLGELYDNDFDKFLDIGEDIYIKLQFFGETGKIKVVPNKRR